MSHSMQFGSKLESIYNTTPMAQRLPRKFARFACTKIAALALPILLATAAPLSTLLATHLAQAKTPQIAPVPGTGMRLSVESNLKNEALYGARIALNFGHYDNLTDLSQTLDLKSDNGIPITPTEIEAVRVNIVVPRGAPETYVRAYSTAVQAQVRKRYPNARFNIQRSYIDRKIEIAQYEAATQALGEAMQAAKLELADDNVSKTDDRLKELSQELQLIEQAQREVAESRSDLLNWESKWTRIAKAKEWLSTPLSRSFMAEVVASIKGTLTATVTVTRYGFNATSLTIGLLNGAVTAALGFYAVEFSNWSTSHLLPFTQRYPWLEKVIKPIGWYNRNSFAKSTTINLFRSLGIAFFVRWAANASGQTIAQKDGTRTLVQSPFSAAFFLEGAGFTATEIAGDSMFDVGLRTLTQKGFLNYVTRSYVIWSVTFVDTFMHAMFRSGATGWAWSAMAVTSALKFTTYMAGRYLPARDKQIVVFSDLIPDQVAIEDPFAMPKGPVRASIAKASSAIGRNIGDPIREATAPARAAIKRTLVRTRVAVNNTLARAKEFLSRKKQVEPQAQEHAPAPPAEPEEKPTSKANIDYTMLEKALNLTEALQFADLPAIRTLLDRGKADAESLSKALNLGPNFDGAKRQLFVDAILEAHRGGSPTPVRSGCLKAFSEILAPAA